MAYYSRRHYRAVSPKADTPEDIAARRRHLAVLAQVHKERTERYPRITPKNVGEVLDWQASRIKELQEVQR